MKKWRFKYKPRYSKWVTARRKFPNYSTSGFRYTNLCIRKIIMNISIVDVIDDLFLKPIQKKRKHHYYLKVSPFTYLFEKPSYRPFFVTTDRKLFKCFHTGKSGNVINFVEEFLKIGKRDAITYLLVKYHDRIPSLKNSYKQIGITRTHKKRIYIYNDEYPF